MTTSFGLQKTTLVDFPGEVAATVFVPGCNLRCPFCHNPDLVLPGSPPPPLTRDEVYAYMEKRRAVLGGICITGGEPLLYPDLASFIADIRSLGLKVKLDTNGTLPDRLAAIVVDYVAMDVKTAPSKYGAFTAADARGIETRVAQSARYLVDSGPAHEFRTTAVPGIVDVDDVRCIIDLIRGAQRYAIAAFRPEHTLDPAMTRTVPYPRAVLEEMRAIAEAAGIPAIVRAHY